MTLTRAPDDRAAGSRNPSPKRKRRVSLGAGCTTVVAGIAKGAMAKRSAAMSDRDRAKIR